MGRLLVEPDRLQRMREAARLMGRPKAAEVVVKTLLAESDSDPVEMNSDQQEVMADQARKR